MKNVVDVYQGMSISDAVESAPEGPVYVHIFPGVYREKVEIRRDDVSIVGIADRPDDVVIECDDYANYMMPDGQKRGTFNSYTFFIKGNRNRIENICIKNTSSPSSKCGQSIALFAEGDGFVAEKCIIKSHQDTLFTGPLPKKEIEKGGFKGPTENDERVIGRQYYKHCRIFGNVDFIFGSAVCLFDECYIVSVYENNYETDPVATGYCLAPSTYEGMKYGYICRRCRFTHSGCPPKTVYIGRPWRDHAKILLIDCYLEEHIKEEGFHDWNKKDAHGKFVFEEFESKGPGASVNRAEYVKILKSVDISGISEEEFFALSLT